MQGTHFGNVGDGQQGFHLHGGSIVDVQPLQQDGNPVLLLGRLQEGAAIGGGQQFAEFAANGKLQIGLILDGVHFDLEGVLKGVRGAKGVQIFREFHGRLADLLWGGRGRVVHGAG